MYYRTQAIVDLDAIKYNFDQAKKKAQGAKVLCIVKANAYGHGAIEIAKLLDKDCDFFGVATANEAVELKEAGITSPALVVGHVPPVDYSMVVEHGIRIPVFTLEDARLLSLEAQKQNKVVPFHFCVDTGMSRIGFQATEESADMCKEICSLPNLEAEGLFSHFATADEEDLSKAVAQRDSFKTFVDMLEARGINIPIKHINNSAGIMNFDEHFDMVRVGIILYGMYPSEDVKKSIMDLKPAMSWLARVSYVKELEAGREISYGGTFKTERPTRVATIPVGYADGYPRALSNKGKVIINGKYANILGRVCMDQFMVDVTDIEGVESGTTATLIGVDGDCSISMEDMGNNAGSINYEMTCRISRRVPRIY